MQDKSQFARAGFGCQSAGLRIVCVVLLLAVCSLTVAACEFPGSARPTVKIGLSAPFEGLYRDRGYEALHAVRLAVRQRNESGGVGSSYWVELVALNDFDEPEKAANQALKMAVDPDVLGVLGAWSLETARMVTPEYKRRGLAVLTPQPEALADSSLILGDRGFVEGYEAFSGGVPPGALAAWAYSSAVRLLDAIDVAVRSEGQPSRTGVQAVLDASQTY
jgi:hypothetical protein